MSALVREQKMFGPLLSPGEATADTSAYSPSDSYTALCFGQPTGSKGAPVSGPPDPRAASPSSKYD